MSERDLRSTQDTRPLLKAGIDAQSLSIASGFFLRIRFWESPAYAKYAGALLAFLLGGAHTLTFAPTPQGGWLALLTLSAFFILLIRTSTAKVAAWCGFAFGLGHFGSGLGWLIVSPYVYGGLSLPLSVLLIALCVLYLSLYPALASWAWHRTLPAQKWHSRALSWQSSIGFACLWTLSEWLRGTLLTGFPWLVSGYTQVDGPLKGFASLIGVYGISGLLAWVAALLAQATILYRAKSAHAPTRIGVRLLICIGCIGTAMACTHLRWTIPQGTPLKIRLLQGNIPQSMKISASNIEGMLALYQKLITQAPADLILTPETAAPLPIHQLPDLFARAIRQFSDQTGSFVALGAIGQTTSSIEDPHFYWTNSVFGIAPNNLAITSYNKRHLVPFGEYTPWGFAQIMEYLQLPLASFMRGALQQADFKVRDQIIAAGICYEDIFGEELARTLRHGRPAANIIINATNLGWFGDTIALAQHLQIAQMRALETGRPMLSAANTGITAAIDPQGKVIAALPPFTTGSLEVTLQGQTGKTPYILYGNIPVLIVCLGGLVWMVFSALLASRPRKTL